MRYAWIYCALILGITALNAAEEVRSPKINNWYTWKNKGSRGKLVRQKPNAQYPQGAVRFDVAPGEGKYAASTYGNEKVTPDKAVKIIVTVMFSGDVNKNVKVTLSLNGKIADGNWYSAFGKQIRPPVKAQFAVTPGKESQAQLELDLTRYNLPQLAMLTPFVSVSDLERGSVAVTGFKFITDEGGKIAPAPKVDSNIGKLQARKGAFKDFSWAAPINWDNFRRQMDYTAIGLNIVKLTPAMQYAAVVWPDDLAVEAGYSSGKWQIASGKKGDMKAAAVIEGDNIDMACCGTAVIFRDSAGKYTFVSGGLANTGATLMLPEGVKTPEVKQIYIGGHALLYCLAEEAQKELDRALKLYKDNIDSVRAHWQSRSKEWLWNQRIEFYTSSVKKVKDEATAFSDGFLPVIAADPILRDRYGWLIWMINGQYSTTGGYFGGEFRKNYYTYYNGRGEIAESLRFAQRLTLLVARARRIAGAAFTEGKAADKLLAAGWTSALADVPLKAGLPKVSNSRKLRMAQGEGESAILVLTSAVSPVENIRIKVTAEQAGSPQVKLYSVKYLSMESAGTPHLPLGVEGDREVADICIPVDKDSNFSLQPHTNLPVLVNVIAGDKTAPGKYNYTCSIQCADGKNIALPLEVVVDNFNPGYKRLASIAGLANKEITDWYPAEFQKTARLNLSEALLECRIMPLQLYSWGAPSPFFEDLPALMKKGLDGVIVSSGMQGLVDPAADLVKFVELYGSKDGKNFVRIPAEVKYAVRKGKVLDAQDITVKPLQKVSDYRYLKVHNTKEIKGVRSQYCQAFLMRESSPPLLKLSFADGKSQDLVESVRAIQSDKKPESGSFDQAQKITSLFFDNYLPRSNRASVLFESGNRDVAEIRLYNNRASVISANIKGNYDAVRRVVGKDMPIYLYGFDEANELEHSNLRVAMKRAKQIAPGIKLVTTACNLKADMDLYELLDIHCVCNAYAIPRLQREIAKKYGTVFWTYVGGGGYYPSGNFERVDQPRINSRAFFWSMLCFDYISGFLYWDINMWRQNKKLLSEPVFDWSKWNCSHGDYSGMGALFYPGPEGTIYPSLRSWTLRDGVEDVNVYRYAQELLKKYPNTLKKLELDAIGSEIARSMTVWCQDIDKLENLREKLYNLVNSIEKK